MSGTAVTPDLSDFKADTPDISDFTPDAQQQLPMDATSQIARLKSMAANSSDQVDQNAKTLAQSYNSAAGFLAGGGGLQTVESQAEPMAAKVGSSLWNRVKPYLGVPQSHPPVYPGGHLPEAPAQGTYPGANLPEPLGAPLGRASTPAAESGVAIEQSKSLNPLKAPAEPYQAQPVAVGKLPLAKGDPYSMPRTPEMEPAQSTTITQHGYHPDSRTMVVEFKNGKVYEYRGVPPEIYKGYQSSESQGSFFANNIKGRYQTSLRGTVKPSAGEQVRKALSQP